MPVQVRALSCAVFYILIYSTGICIKKRSKHDMDDTQMSVDFTQKNTSISGAIQNANQRQRRNENFAQRLADNRYNALASLQMVLSQINKMENYQKLVQSHARRSREPHDHDHMDSKLEMMTEIINTCVSLVVTIAEPVFAGQDYFRGGREDMVLEKSRNREEYTAFVASILDAYSPSRQGGQLFPENITESIEEGYFAIYVHLRVDFKRSFPEDESFERNVRFLCYALRDLVRHSRQHAQLLDPMQNNTSISGFQSNAQKLIRKNRKTAVKYILTTLNGIKQLRDYHTLVAEQARRSREGDAEMASKLEAIFELNIVFQVCLSIIVHPLYHPEFSKKEVIDIVDDMTQYSKETQVEFAESILDKYAEGKAGPTRGGVLTEPVQIRVNEYLSNYFLPKMKEFIDRYGDDQGYVFIIFKKVARSIQDLIKLDRSQRQSQLETLEELYNTVELM